MKFEQLSTPSPEEMARIEKERILSDADLLKGGAEFKFEEGGKILGLTSEQIEAIRQEMEKDLESRKKVEKEKSIEKETVEKVTKMTKKVEGRTGKVFDISYDTRGNKIEQASGPELDFGGGVRQRASIESYSYNDKNQLIVEGQLEYDGGYRTLNEKTYDGKGNILSNRWEWGAAYKRLSSWGKINFEYTFNEQGKLFKKTGRGKSDEAEILILSAYQHDSSKNLVIENEKKITKHFAGPLSGQEYESDVFYLREYTNEGKLKIEAKIYEGKEGGKIRDITTFSYNEKGDLIKEQKLLTEDDEVKSKEIVDYDLEYGSLEIEKSLEQKEK